MSSTHPFHHDPVPHAATEPRVAHAFASALLSGDRADLLRLLAPRTRLHHHLLHRTIGGGEAGRAPSVAATLLDPDFWGGTLEELLWLPHATSLDRNSARYRALVREQPGRHEGDLHLFFDPAAGQVHAVHHLAVPPVARRGQASRPVVGAATTSRARGARALGSGGDRAGQRREVT